MAFEHGPEIGNNGITEHRSLRGWLTRHERALYVIIGGLSIIILFLAGKVLYPSLLTNPPGGLDGCLTTLNGTPVSATVWVGDISRPTYADGCFFFPNLSPGLQQVRIETVSGQSSTQSVEIVSGQAVGLGNIFVTP
jgi:hypothetical protein